MLIYPEIMKQEHDSTHRFNANLIRISGKIYSFVFHPIEVMFVRMWFISANYKIMPTQDRVFRSRVFGRLSMLYYLLY